MDAGMDVFCKTVLERKVPGQGTAREKRCRSEEGFYV